MGLILLLCVSVCLHSLTCVKLLATPWTIAHQAPLSMKFPGKKPGVGCHFLLQGLFLTQGVSCIGRQILYYCSTWEAPILLLHHGAEDVYMCGVMIKTYYLPSTMANNEDLRTQGLETEYYSALPKIIL